MSMAPPWLLLGAFANSTSPRYNSGSPSHVFIANPFLICCSGCVGIISIVPSRLLRRTFVNSSNNDSPYLYASPAPRMALPSGSTVGGMGGSDKFFIVASGIIRVSRRAAGNSVSVGDQEVNRLFAGSHFDTGALLAGIRTRPKHFPQRGKEVISFYLSAAARMASNDSVIRATSPIFPCELYGV